LRFDFMWVILSHSHPHFSRCAEAAAAAAAPSMPMHLMSQPPFPDPHQHGIPNPGRDSIFGGSSLVGAGGVDTDDLLSSGMDVFDDDDFDACLNSLS
jgi:hypothetical protein